MSKEESLSENVQILFNTIQHGIDKIKRAWKEENITLDEWECINKNVLYFHLMEKDIINIHNKMKQDNVVILGTRVTINKVDKLIEIKTYTQEGDKFFKYPKIGKFESLSNLPSDVETELEKEGSVTIEPSLS